jgi:hypothetical protein
MRLSLIAPLVCGGILVAAPAKDYVNLPIPEEDMPASRPGRKTWIVALVAIASVAAIVNLPALKIWWALHF